MPSSQRQAGNYILKSFKVKPLYDDRVVFGSDDVELAKVITDWAISESLHTAYVSGSATIHESDNILEDLPIRGEEEIEITYVDFYETTHTKKFFLYSVEDIRPESAINDRMARYKIKFTTNQKLFSDRKSIRRSFAKQRISDMVQVIYDDYFITGNKEYDKEIEIEQTDGEQTLIIPNMKPDAAMHFLSRRAYSSENKTSSFRFFETREKYFFCTHEYLIEKYADFDQFSEESRNRLFFIYSVMNDNTGPGQIQAQQSISSVSFPSKVDSFADMKQGAYRRKIVELDINYRTRIERTFDYTEEYKDYKMPEEVKLTHSSEFIEEYMAPADSPDTVLVTDFPQIGVNPGKDYMLRPYQHFYENYTNKLVTNYHNKRNALGISIHGRSDLYPGMIIDLNLYKFSNTLAGTRERDTQRSGKYLVTDIENNFNGDQYTQSLRITKGGLS